MIIAYLGTIGSGKSLSVVREIVIKNQFVYTNFNLKKLTKHHRILFNDVIITAEKRKDWRVNWEFWNKASKSHKKFSICLDEIHNLAHSRESMTRKNILMSKWVSQVRKILSDSESNHLYIISQTLSKIDKDFRDLVHIFIECKKIEIKHKGKTYVYIIQTFYKGLKSYELGISSHKSYFLGNPYFKFYNTKEMVHFSDVEEFI